MLISYYTSLLIFFSGDFNARVGRIPGLEANHPDTNANCPLFLSFVQNTDLVILNTLPVCKVWASCCLFVYFLALQGLFTHFVDRSDGLHSEAVLDYGLISAGHEPMVSCFTIDRYARFDCGADHALLTVTLHLGTPTTPSTKFDDAIKFKFPASGD